LEYGYALLTKAFLLTEIRYWSWWYWPVFGSIVICTIVRYFLVQYISSTREYGENQDCLNQLQRILTMIVLGLMFLLICVHSDIAATTFARKIHAIKHPWWRLSLVFSFLIVVLGSLWFVQKYRENSKSKTKMQTTPKSATRQSTISQSVPAPQPQIAAPLKGFNMSMGGGKTRGGFQRQNQTERDSFFDRLGISAGFSFLRENKLLISLIVGGVILLAVLIYFGYKLLTMEWIDAEGYPIAKPWWLYLIPFLLLGCGILVYKIIGMIRENAAERSSRPDKNSPARTQQRSQKPTGFNKPSSGRGFQPGFQQQTQQSSLRNLFSHPVTWIVSSGIGVLLLVVVLLLIFR
jgi:Flp pilus assembly protein TadB